MLQTQRYHGIQVSRYTRYKNKKTSLATPSPTSKEAGIRDYKQTKGLLIMPRGVAAWGIR